MSRRGWRTRSYERFRAQLLDAAQRKPVLTLADEDEFNRLVAAACALGDGEFHTALVHHYVLVLSHDADDITGAVFGPMLWHISDLAASWMALVQSGGDLNSFRRTGETALMVLCRSRPYISELTAIICSGVDLDAVDPDGRTAIGTAIMYDNRACTSALVAYGGNPSEADRALAGADVHLHGLDQAHIAPGPTYAAHVGNMAALKWHYRTAASDDHVPSRAALRAAVPGANSALRRTIARISGPWHQTTHHFYHRGVRRAVIAVLCVAHRCSSGFSADRTMLCKRSA
jgi:hypothetical protein